MLMKMWNKWNSHILLMGVQNGTITLNNSLAVSYQKKLHLPHDSATPVRGVYPREVKTHAHTHKHKKTYTGMLSAALWIITKTERELKGSSKGEWMKRTSTRWRSISHWGSRHVNEFQRYYGEGKKLPSKDYKLYDSVDMISGKSKITGAGNRGTAARGLGEESDHRQGTLGDFWPFGTFWLWLTVTRAYNYIHIYQKKKKIK